MHKMSPIFSTEDLAVMLLSRFIYNRFGLRYFVTSKPNIKVKSVAQVEFLEILQAKRFVRSLVVPNDYWLRLVHQFKTTNSGSRGWGVSIEDQVAYLLLARKLQVYEVGNQVTSEKSAPVVHKDPQGSSYRFCHPATLLQNRDLEIKHFKTVEEAKNFLQIANLDNDQLKVVAQENNLKFSNESNVASVVCEALVSGEIVLVVTQEPASPPKPDQVSGPSIGIPGNRIAGLGPAVEEVVCGICHASSLVVNCGHSGRSIGQSNVIQIVPTPNRTSSDKVSVMGVTIEVQRQYGGSDEINGKLSLVDDKLGSCPNMKDEKGEWANTDNLNLEIKAVQENSPNLWAINDPPEVYSIAGKGCTGSTLEKTIEVYPNHYYSIEGKLDIFREWEKEVNKAWEDWGKSIFDISPVSLKPKLTGPAGSFKAGWGWKENNDWRSYFDVTADFGLNPILGVEIEISVSLVKLAMTSAGIPPTLQSLTTEHLADLQVFGGAGCKGKVQGSPHGKFFPDGSHEIDGEARFEIEGGVKLGLRGKLGSKYIVSAELILSGETKVKGEDLLELNSSGLYVQSRMNLEPLEAVAKVVVKYLVIFSKSEEKKWKPWDAMEIYKSEKKKLLPAD